jgi:hypothetical protein
MGFRTLLALAVLLPSSACIVVSESNTTTTRAVGTETTAPAEEVVRASFRNDADLARWKIGGGQWRVEKLGACGRQAGDRYAYLTWPAYFGSISSVTIRGGVADDANRNFRVAVGHVSAILNWEVRDADVFSDGHSRSETSPGSLAPGDDHEIRFVQDDEVIRILVDGIQRWETRGRLRGTVTIYPAVGSVIRIRSVEIRGVPVPWIAVDGPSQPAP